MAAYHPVTMGRSRGRDIEGDSKSIKRHRPYGESESEVAVGAGMMGRILDHAERERETITRSGGGGGSDGVPPSTAMIHRKDPVYHMYSDLRTTGVISSYGRGSTITPQSVIDLVVIKDIDLYKKRARTPEGEWLAPLGSRDCFAISQGEWLYSIYDPSGLSVRNTLYEDAEARVFSTVNGLNADTPIRFVGIAATVNRSEMENTDDRSAAIISGTSTGVNLGPDTIPQFSLVCFSSFPYTCTTSGHKGMRPAIQEVGIPLDKFRPATYQLRDGDVFTACLRMRRVVTDRWNNARFNDPTEIDDDPAKTHEGILRVYDATVDILNRESRKTGITGIGSQEILPVKAYGFWVNVGVMLEEASAWIERMWAMIILTTTADECANMFKMIRLLIQGIETRITQCADLCHKKQESKEYEEEKFGRVAAHKNTLIPMISELHGAWKSAESVANRLTRDTDGKIEKKTEVLQLRRSIIGMHKLLNHLIQEKQLKAQCEQANWQRRHIMGMSLTSSGPGKPLNLMMGYYS
jgi:hypothetical protein